MKENDLGLLTVGTVGVLQEGFFRAFCDLVERRRKRTQVPNAFLRELGGLHANTTLSGLEQEFRKDISQASSLILAYINKMGFKLVPKE